MNGKIMGIIKVFRVILIVFYVVVLWYIGGIYIFLWILLSILFWIFLSIKRISKGSKYL